MRSNEVGPGIGPGWDDAGPGGCRVGSPRFRFWTRGRIGVLITAAIALHWLPRLDGPPEALPVRLAIGCRGVEIWRLAFRPDGQTIAAIDERARLRLQPAAGDLGPVPQLDVGTLLNAVPFSPDGRHLAVWDEALGVVLLDLDRGGPGRRLGIPIFQPSCLSFSPDGQALAVAGVRSPDIILWDIAADKPRMVLRAEGSPVTHVAFGPDGRSLTSVSHPGVCGRDPVVLIWDLPSGRPRARLQASWGSAVAFSSDGRLLAMPASGPRRIELRDAQTGALVRPIIVPPGLTHAIAVSPDARLVATVADGGLLSVWSTATGRELLRCQSRADVLHHLAFSPDGRALAAAGNGGDILFWDLGGSIADAASAAGGCGGHRSRLPDETR